MNRMSKIAWSGEVVSVQPCIDRLRSFIYVPDYALNYGLIHE